MSTASRNLQARAPVHGNELVRGYRPELDATRFLAFFFVFICHFLVRIPNGEASLRFLAGRNSSVAYRALEEAASCGVCLFFSLSAYLITNLLLKERAECYRVSVKKFYIRRALRIWPLYFLGIGIGIGIAVLLGQEGDAVGFLWCLVFVGNFYFGTFGFPHNPMAPLWSISIEEQFYLVWPWAMRWLSNRGLVLCALILILQANVTLFITGDSLFRHAFRGGMMTPIQFELFAAGILLSMTQNHLTWRNSTAGVGLVLFGPTLWFLSCYLCDVFQSRISKEALSGPVLIIFYGAVALGSVAILQGFCMIGPERVPRLAVRLGRISYGLYVFHVLAIDFAVALVPPTKGAIYVGTSFLVACLLTVSLALISYEYLESPFLALKRRFEVIHSRPI
ncbi:MAG TPA: acyltransferase [Terracidiphilus sp.]|nr:acyltransferase [Terracidiphilus sp.]